MREVNEDTTVYTLLFWSEARDGASAGWEPMLGSKGKGFVLSLLGEAAALQLGEAVTVPGARYSSPRNFL